MPNMVRRPGYWTMVSGLQKGPAERGHVKTRQKSSKSVKKFFDTFRQFSRRAKNVKNRQKVSKSFSTLFDKFRAAPFFRPVLGGSEMEMNGGSSAPHLACTPCVPLFVRCLIRVEAEGLLDFQGRAGIMSIVYGGTFARSYSVSTFVRNGETTIK